MKILLTHPPLSIIQGATVSTIKFITQFIIARINGILLSAWKRKIRK